VPAELVDVGGGCRHGGHDQLLSRYPRLDYIVQYRPALGRAKGRALARRAEDHDAVAAARQKTPEVIQIERPIDGAVSRDRRCRRCHDFDNSMLCHAPVVPPAPLANCRQSVLDGHPPACQSSPDRRCRQPGTGRLQ
jgi:hypothetical protein